MLMKIIIGSDQFRPSIGGTETVTHNIAKGMVELGHEVVVVAPGNKIFSSYWEENSDPYRILRVGSLPIVIAPKQRLGVFSGGAIKRLVKDFKPDIVHANNPFSITKRLIKYCRSSSIPIVIGGHLMPESFLQSLRSFKGLYQSLRKLGWRRIVSVYNQGDLVITPTETSVRYLEQFGLKIPALAISNGIDIKANTPSSRPSSYYRHALKLAERPSVVYIGRLGVEKELEVLIEAIAELKTEEGLDFQLLLVGDGNDRKNLEKLAVKIAPGRVIFTGFVSGNKQKRQYLLAGDCFTISSPVELQSLVTLEAIACGRAVIALNEGALPELVHHHKNGELFEYGDLAGLKKAIKNILTNESLRQRYGEASRRLSLKHDIEAMPRHYEKAYQKLIRSKKD